MPNPRAAIRHTSTRILALIIGLGLAACGSSSMEPGPSPEPTVTVAPAPTTPPPVPSPSTTPAIGPGALDQSFGDGGLAIVPIRGVVSSARRGLFVFPDGRVSLLALKRADAFLDADLLRVDLAAGSDNAVVSHPLPSFRAEAAAFAPDGSAVVIGEREGEEGEVVAARLAPDGRLDTTFGDGGFASTGLESRSYGGQPEVLFLPDGRVLSFARSRIVRLTAGGDVDRTFGEDGVALPPTPLPPRSEEFFTLDDIGIAPDGRLIVSAVYHVSISIIPNLIALTSEGERDLSFGEMGLVSYHTLGANGRLFVMADGNVVWLVQSEMFLVSPDGKAVITVADRPPRVGLEGFNETAEGIAAVGFSWVPDEPRRLDCEYPDGSDLCVRRVVAVQSVNAEGVLDSGFGNGGTVLTDLPPPYGADGTGAQAIVAAPAGRLTVAGSACRAPKDCDLVLLRYIAP